MTAPDPLPKGDEWKCGGGKKARCCRYLLFNAAGFHCSRDHSPELAEVLRARGDSMTARRTPEEPYPECQLK